MRIAAALLSLCWLAGCGPSGKLATYNPTNDVLTVTVGSVEEGVGPGETRVLRWSGSPFTIGVQDESGAPVEQVEITPERGDRWLFHHVGGDRCFGIADFGNLFVSGTDGSLDQVSAVEATTWTALDREMDVWPGQKLPIYTETPEVWGMVEIACGMTVDKANTHAAIQGRIHELKPR